jgi:hypothetical protein
MVRVAALVCAAAGICGCAMYPTVNHLHPERSWQADKWDCHALAMRQHPDPVYSTGRVSGSCDSLGYCSGTYTETSRQSAPETGAALAQLSAEIGCMARLGWEYPTAGDGAKSKAPVGYDGSWDVPAAN